MEKDNPMSDEPKILRSSTVSAKFRAHLKTCDRCWRVVHNWSETPNPPTIDEMRSPLNLCDDGKKILRYIFS